jgi:hypothetical protein
MTQPQVVIGIDNRSLAAFFQYFPNENVAPF